MDASFALGVVDDEEQRARYSAPTAEQSDLSLPASLVEYARQRLGSISVAPSAQERDELDMIPLNEVRNGSAQSSSKR